MTWMLYPLRDITPVTKFRTPGKSLTSKDKVWDWRPLDCSIEIIVWNYIYTRNKKHYIAYSIKQQWFQYLLPKSIRKWRVLVLKIQIQNGKWMAPHYTGSHFFQGRHKTRVFSYIASKFWTKQQGLVVENHTGNI